MTNEGTAPQGPDEVQAQVTQGLNEAFELMEKGEVEDSAERLLEVAGPSTAHLMATLGVLAASSAARLREAMPVSEDAYYGFLALDADTDQPTQLPAPMAFASRFLTSALNLDSEQGAALMDAMLDSEDSEYMLQCLTAMFMQAFHIHAGHIDPTSIDLGSTTMKGLAILTDREPEK